MNAEQAIMQYHLLKNDDNNTALVYLFIAMNDALGKEIPEFPLLFTLFAQQRSFSDFIDWIKNSNSWQIHFPFKQQYIHDFFNQDNKEYHLSPLINSVDIENYYTNFLLNQSVFHHPLVDQILARHIFSATSLNCLLKNKYEFFWNNIVRIPVPSKPVFVYGKAFHYALEQLFRKMQNSKIGLFPEIHEFQEDFLQYLNANKYGLNEAQLELFKNKGLKNLAQYYQTHIHSATNRIVSIEKSISNVFVDGIAIKGFIDKITFNGKQCTIVDYKTGKTPSDSSCLTDAYKRQLTFYFLLISGYAYQQKNYWQPVEYHLEYVEPNSFGEYEKLIFQNEDLDVNAVVEELRWGKSLLNDFYN